MFDMRIDMYVGNWIWAWNNHRGPEVDKKSNLGGKDLKQTAIIQTF